MTQANHARQPRFLTLDEVLTLHETVVDEHGGSPGVRDSGLLESALAMPRQGFDGEYAHEFPFGMAAAYAFHLCKNHPFVDGNKRTAFACAAAFLRQNGWSLTASEEEAATILLRVAERGLDKSLLAAWLRSNSRPRPSMELRDFFARLDYKVLSEKFQAIAHPGHPDEQVATYLEAGRMIPAIPQGQIGAMHAEGAGDQRAAESLRQHAVLLAAIYRIAEDMGYEW